ncbi:helix-turn-helix domain-containing protein [Micromonospora sp. LOL_021]|uniref:helix-turn-helix domain-containing protein n=1 Tax=Micromonospora sp. LOL_021 TaxID=3345417 RepID=UPI003A855005
MPASPTIRRQRLGGELRRLRRVAAMTLEQVCDQLGWASTSKLSRLELGQSRPDLADILDLLDVYNVVPTEREKLVIIARDAAATRGRWKALGSMGQRQRGYTELEASAATIFQYQQLLVPGLLQTPEYARLRVRSGRDVYGDLDVNADTLARTARQEVLRREHPPHYEAVIDESALLRASVPPETRRGQLRHRTHSASWTRSPSRCCRSLRFCTTRSCHTPASRSTRSLIRPIPAPSCWRR